MSDTSVETITTKIAPGPPGNLLLTSLFGSDNQGLLASYIDLWSQFGDVARIKAGPLVIHQIVRPEHVRHVLVQNVENYPKGFSHDKLRVALGNGILTSEGDFWKRQRRLMQPTYTPTSVTRFAEIMVDATERMLQGWQYQARNGDMLRVNQEMMRLTMSVISRSMFGIDISENFADAGQALIDILEFTAKRSMAFIDPPLFLPTPLNRRYKRALRTIDGFLYRIIEERRSQPLGGDLLSLLMTAQDEETGEVMDDKQLRDEVLITFFAGHETTAQLLTWAWYLLAKHPHVVEKLQAELARVLGGRAPTTADVPDLSYTRMILDETLRLYSPVGVLARDPVADDEIGGYHIPGGSLLTITPFITHRHPEFWESPEAFLPERFEPELVKQRPRYAYMPFGAGPRICIGNHFALLEGTLVLAHVAQRYHLEAIPGIGIRPEFVGVLRPDQDVMMTLVERRLGG